MVFQLNYGNISGLYSIHSVILISLTQQISDIKLVRGRFQDIA